MILNTLSIFLIVLIVFLLLGVLLLGIKNKKQKIEIKAFDEKVQRLSSEIQSNEKEISELRLKSNTSYASSQISKIENLTSELEKYKTYLEEEKIKSQEAKMKQYDFMSDVREEVKSNVEPILTFVDLLSVDIKEMNLLHYLKSIARSSQKILLFMDNTIEIAKLELGSVEVQNRVVDIQNLFYTLIEEHQPSADAKNLDFSLEIDENMPNSLIMDDQKVKDILNNLIENAIKFTPEGYVKVKLMVNNLDTRKNEVDILVSVEDSGVGIARENQNKIFEIFDAKENAHVAENRTSGLGLCLNKKIAKLMNGDITFRSELSKGSTFKLLLKGVEIVLYSAKDKIDEENVNFSFIKPEGGKIMVIDESLEDRNTIEQSFIQTAVKVFAYEHPREAIVAFKENKFDIVFIDLEVLVGDDSAVSKVIAKMSKAPVVTITSRSLKNVEFIDSGVNVVGHLQRPISKMELFKISIKTLNLMHLMSTPVNINIKQSDLESVDIKKSKEFLSVHYSELEAIYQEARSTNDLSVIQLFSETLLKLAFKYKIKIFSDFAKELLEHTERFDIDSINTMMESYSGMIKKLESL
ncbi:response regulator [Sulfurimonas aquatica]|uniref:histidine kinase n=1 Tax=Sulfurimonas aquatica TaxID=2672570 RepID=A0A975GCQ0_9BACT|nr:ATP-binding protein [Sulfurimonas aquatica]QSZ41855.1 response regulator [Sulfurimonas aquatica]